MVKVSGTRFIVTLASDDALPEAERRSFTFLNPSVKTFERIEAECKGDDAGTLNVSKAVHRLLRGWSNVKTEDAEVAKKYGVSEAVGDGVAIDFSADRETDLLDLLTLADYRDLVTQVFATLNPVPSGN